MSATQKVISPHLGTIIPHNHYRSFSFLNFDEDEYKGLGSEPMTTSEVALPFSTGVEERYAVLSLCIFLKQMKCNPFFKQFSAVAALLIFFYLSLSLASSCSLWRWSWKGWGKLGMQYSHWHWIPSRGYKGRLGRMHGVDWGILFLDMHGDKNA
jgi:hypothetical protein